MRHACRPRLLVRRPCRESFRRLSTGGDGRGRPAVHPLHLRLDRTAEGRGAHLRRLSRLCRHDASIRLRLSRRRRLLVHGRCRLGHRPLVHRLRAARQRRDHADVRGRAKLSRRLAHVAGGRQARGQYLLYGADGDQGADGRWRRFRHALEPEVASPARQRRRADQSGSLGVVLPRGRRGALPNRRHLVADRDRRHPHHASALAQPSSSLARRRCPSSAFSQPWSTARAICWRGRSPAIS